MGLSAHASDFEKAAEGGRNGRYFWKRLDLVVLLAQPVSDAIHQLEADRPLLSQVWKVWQQLLAHATEFDERTALGMQDVAPLFKDYYKKHFDATWVGAWLLDPAAVLSMHATSCASERNWSLWGNLYVKARNRLAIERAEMLVYIRGNSNKGLVSKFTDEEILLQALEADDE